MDYQPARLDSFRLPLLPDETTGLIEAFGIVLTFTPANYYGLVSNRHLARMEKAIGPDVLPLVLNMLIESGHVCAFNTIGAILQSAEWDAVVRPIWINQKTGTTDWRAVFQLLDGDW